MHWRDVSRVAAAVLTAMVCASVACAGITTSLDAHWTFDETSGNFADSAGGDDTAVPTGSPYGSGNNGILGNAMVCAGSGYAVSANAGDAIDTPQTSFSGSFWVKLYSNPEVTDNGVYFMGRRATADSGRCLFTSARDEDNANPNPPYQTWSSDRSQLVLELRSSTGEYTRLYSSDKWLSVLNTWFHVGYTFEYVPQQPGGVDGCLPLQAMAIYVDGVKVASEVGWSYYGNVWSDRYKDTDKTDSIAGADSLSFGLGVRVDDRTSILDGEMDDAALWLRKLDAKEMALIHAMARFEGLTITDSKLNDALTAFDTQGEVKINGRKWQYATSLGSTTIGVTSDYASTEPGDYVVLDASGNGLKVSPPAGTLIMFR